MLHLDGFALLRQKAMAMYYKWLDQWDERRAQRGEQGKTESEFILDAQRAFPGASDISSITAFCRLADRVLAEGAYFDAAPPNAMIDDSQTGWITFPSSETTDIPPNNTVWAKITDSGARDHALVIFHHWNARSRQTQLARFLSRRGITVVEMVLPYHFERSRPGATHADFMLSANLGRSLQSLRQAVWDGRALVHQLQGQGYRKISVLGMSLGAWVAGLVAAHDPSVTKASLFLPGGSLADMVWSGRATRLIRKSLETKITVSELNRAWGLVNLENYAVRLARKDLDLQIVMAKRDEVVLPDISHRFLSGLKQAGATPNSRTLGCGHYSLGLPPYSLLAGFGLFRFLTCSP